MAKSLFQHAIAHAAQLGRRIVDEAVRRFADSGDVLLMEVNDDRFPPRLRKFSIHRGRSRAGVWAAWPSAPRLKGRPLY